MDGIRIFLAGASGAIGRQLVPMLLASGHTVVGMTRSQERAAALERLGAGTCVCDAYDRAELIAKVSAARPELVVHQLTALPQDYPVRRRDLNRDTDRIRREGTRNLIDASRAAGCTRVIAQSVAFLYSPDVGSEPRTETDPPYTDAPEPFAGTVAALLDLEAQVLSDPEIRGAVLRYGWLYGPGTWYAPSGYFGHLVKRRRYPIVGAGSGVWSFLHVKDAARATGALVESDAAGVFNIVDDEPAPMRDWLPAFAHAIDAPPPSRVPSWVARLAAGKLAVQMSTRMPGATNTKAKAEIGWRPTYATWRDGFRTDRRPAPAPARTRDSTERPDRTS